MRRHAPAMVLAAALGFAFLWLPVAVMVLFSFNGGRLVGVWSGFSLEWYGALFSQPPILSAAALSLKIAAISATFSVGLGTLAAVALARFGRFFGRPLFGVMLGVPLVLPEVITGLSLLLAFVGLRTLFGWPERTGFLTIVLAHTSFGMAYATVIITSRLVRLDPTLQEAARDLGASPARAFLDTTIPAITPALIAAWLLAFTLSLDDLVIASFVSGPGATTLPMLIYSKIRLGISPDINALATLLIAAVATGTLGAALVLNWRAFRR
jgi:putrescine transport system permease protein